MDTSLLCPHMAERARVGEIISLISLLITAPIPFMKVHPHDVSISQRPHFLISPQLGLGLQLRDFEESKHSAHSNTVMKVLCYWPKDRKVDQWGLWKEIHVHRINWLWQKYKENSLEKRIVFSANDTRTTEHTYIKIRTLIHTSHHLQKLTQNQSQT